MSLSALRSPPFYTQMDTLQYANECDFDADYSPTHSFRMNATDERGFGDRLNDLMQAHPHYRGRGQSALARDTGVPQATISRILKKKNAPEMATVVELARALGVACEWMLTERGPKYVGNMRIGGSVNPDESITELQNVQVISVLIKRLQDLNKEVQDILSIAQGSPLESVPSESPHDMSIASVIRDVEATKGLVGGDPREGKEHGHGRSRQPRKRSKT